MEIRYYMKNNQKIPEGWSVKKLGLCLSLLKDGTHGTHIDVPNGIMLLSAKDVINGQIILSKDSRRISIGDFNLLHKKYHIQNGDVVLTIVGTIGRCAIIDNYNDNYTFQRSVAILRPYKEITSKYLLTYIQGSSFQKELLKRQSVSAQPGVYLDDLSKIYLLLPPLPEQEKIAEILGTWDEAIEKLSSLIEQKKLIKKGLMQKLLTGKVRLPGFTQPWKEVKLGNFLKEHTEKTTENDQYQVLSVTKNGICSQEEYFEKQIASENNIGYKILRKHDIVFSPMNLWMGSIGFSEYDIGIVSPAYKIFSVNENVALFSFLKHFMIINRMIYLYLINSEQGASIVRRNLDLDGLLSSKVSIPDITEQQAIADVLSAADDEINLLNKKLEALKEQKKGLMQQLLTGQIRVKVN